MTMRLHGMVRQRYGNSFLTGTVQHLQCQLLGSPPMETLLGETRPQRGRHKCHRKLDAHQSSTTMYKTYSAIIARRIASWAISTSAFSDAQNGFVTFDGCAEHNVLLYTIMTDSRRHRHNLVLTWLDLCDTFGSVPHHLMLSIMKRLSVPVRVGARGRKGHLLPLHDCCTHWEGIIHTCDSPEPWSKTGMFLKHLDTSNTGYTLVGHSINSLAYADNICIIASSKEGIQSLLDRCKEFADWVDLMFNVRKCGSLCLVNEAELETSSPYGAQSVSV